MRQKIATTTNRFVAKKVSIGRRAVVIISDKERIEVPVPDGVPEDMTLS